MNTNIAVAIKTTKRNGNDALTPTLWATLAADPNALTPFAVPNVNVAQRGSPV